MTEEAYAAALGLVVLALLLAAIVYAARWMYRPAGSGYGTKAATAAGALVALVAVANVYNAIHEVPAENAGSSDSTITSANDATPQRAALRHNTSRQMPDAKEFVWIRENQRILAKKLKDPDSAKFGDDYVSYKTGAPVVCGTVNARNSFGGYSGPERYIGGGNVVGVFLSSEVSDFDALWNKVCT